MSTSVEMMGEVKLQRLRQLEHHRLEHDLTFSSQVASDWQELEEQELSNLQAELLRFKNEAETRKEDHFAAIEHSRELAIAESAEEVSNLSGGLRNKPKNLLGLIAVTDRLIATQLSAPLLSHDSPHPNATPGAEKYAKNAGTSFGLLTPDHTPPTGHDSRFGTLKVPSTPTPKPRQSAKPSNRHPLPASREFGPALATAVNTTRTLLPATRAHVSVSDSELEGGGKVRIVVIDLCSDTEEVTQVSKRSGFEVGGKVKRLVLDITSDNDEELPPTKRGSFRPAVSTPSTCPKLIQKPSTPAITAVSSLNVSSKELVDIAESAALRDPSPGIFDSDSDYSETGSHKRRNNRSVGSHRVRTGATIMGDLLDKPSSALSAKGIPFWKWSRLVYFPNKLLKFSVDFIWTHQENGELSTFNDRTSPVGFYLARKAHAFIPIIGHADKEDIHPEFVLEEDEISNMQYNSENAVVCVTRSIGIPDVVIKFLGRDDLWNFLVISRDAMDVRVAEKYFTLPYLISLSSSLVAGSSY